MVKMPEMVKMQLSFTIAIFIVLLIVMGLVICMKSQVSVSSQPSSSPDDELAGSAAASDASTSDNITPACAAAQPLISYCKNLPLFWQAKIKDLQSIWADPEICQGIGAGFHVCKLTANKQAAWIAKLKHRYNVATLRYQKLQKLCTCNTANIIL